MNRLETWFCGSSIWQHVTRRQVLPWILEGSELGEHALELGAGPGAATAGLRREAARGNSLEYEHGFGAGLGGMPRACRFRMNPFLQRLPFSCFIICVRASCRIRPFWKYAGCSVQE